MQLQRRHRLLQALLRVGVVVRLPLQLRFQIGDLLLQRRVFLRALLESFPGVAHLLLALAQLRHHRIKLSLGRLELPLQFGDDRAGASVRPSVADELREFVLLCLAQLLSQGLQLVGGRALLLAQVKLQPPAFALGLLQLVGGARKVLLREGQVLGRAPQ